MTQGSLLPPAAAGSVPAPVAYGDFRIQYVQQLSSCTCAHACLSMLTGIPIVDLIERWHDVGMSFENVATILSENALWAERVSTDFGIHDVPEGVYYATVASLNRAGGTHALLLVITRDKEILFDPNAARPGVHHYRHDALDPQSTEGDGCMLTSVVSLHRIIPLTRHAAYPVWRHCMLSI